jgi:hypothetical protein
LMLSIGGSWSYCQSCRSTQRPYPGINVCFNCANETLVRIDPNIDPVFSSRKGYYRASTIGVLKSPPIIPMSLIAAEHTAQLNSAEADDVFSKAEEYELLFQDVDLGEKDGSQRMAIDVLSRY